MATSSVCSFNIPAITAGNLINGIEVTVEGSGTTTRDVAVDLSWNAGGTFTGGDPTIDLGSIEQVFTEGDTTDTWGRTWAVGDFTAANFRVRLTNDGDAGTSSIDHIQVNVHYDLPPEMNVQGNSVSIADGDTTPVAADFTNFGNVPENFFVDRTFTIQNTGTGVLNIGAITFTGGDNGDFSVVTAPSATVAPGGSTTFTVRLTSGGGGTRNTTINIANNDTNENPYNFDVQGTSINAEVNAQGLATNIADGDAFPSATDCTNFGNVQVGNFVDCTYTIQNLGPAAANVLSVGTVTLGGADAADFLVTIQPTSLVAFPGSTTFTVRFTPSTTGARNATVSFVNNDGAESPYNWSIQGTGTVPSEINVQGNGVSIADGDTTPNAADFTDFGNVPENFFVDRTFTIQNTGTADLAIGAITFIGGNAGDFSVVSAPAATVTPGSSTTFTVRLTSGGAGTPDTTINIVNNDTNENPYNFDVQGTTVNAEVNVQGLGVNITDGDGTPSALDCTNFGSVVVLGFIDCTYTIQNLGPVSANILSVGTVTVGGANAGDFSVTVQPTSPVANAGSTTFTVRFIPSATGARNATLSFINNDGGTESPYNWSIQGTGLANTAPTITSNGGGATATIAVAENATAVTTVTATDPNVPPQTLTYSIAGTDAGNFSIVPATGVLTFSPAPDFETPTDADINNSYIVIVQVSDGVGTDTQTLTVNVTDVNETPADIALSASSINENVAANSTMGTLSSTDPDAGNTFTYTLVAGTGDTDNASFNISGSSLLITSGPDFETKNSYSVRIRTTDQGGLSYEEVFTITINDINETPTDIALSASAINENVAANSTVGTLSSTDPDASDTFTYTLVAGTGDTDNVSFNISGNSLRITSSPDFETQNSYSVRIRTTDQGGLSYEEAFTITINDVNEDPTDIALSASSINENVAANSTVGTLNSTDPDVANTFTYTLVIGLGDTDNASFNISSNSLRITTSPDFETQNSYSVRIQTTDQGGLSYEESFTITINDINETPTDIALSTSSINENVAANSTVGTLSSTDADAGNTFTYTLVAGTGDTDNASFNISGSSLRITSSPDFETKNSYSVRVRTTDQGSLSYEEAFTITINDVNEDPTDIALSATSIAENNAVNAVIGALNTTDPDVGNTFTYSLACTVAGADDASFNINAASLRANAAFDFETKNSYAICIRTTDQGGLFFDENFTITITDVDEIPPVTTIDSTTPSTTPTNLTTLDVAFSSNEGGSTFQCSLDANAYVACTSPINLVGLSEGPHTFSVYATDPAGNDDPTPASYTWTVDTTAPDTALVTTPSNPSNDSTPIFTFTSSDVTATFQCSVDGGVFSACATPNTLAALIDGSHTFQVRAVDTASNVDATPASFTWIIDLTTPNTTITSNPSNPTNSTSASFDFIGDDGSGSGSGVASFECDLDGGGFSACASPQSYSGLSDGSHTFQVRAVDAVGNTDPTPASFTWVIDMIAPITTIDSNPLDPDNDATPTFTFSGDDGVGSGIASFECQIDAGGFSACSTPITLASLADGLHTFQVRAIDNVANVDATPASYTWTIDTTAPDTSITTNPSDPSADNTPDFSFTGSDTGGSGVASFECQIDSGGFSACTSGSTFGPLGDGSRTFEVRALDNAGNVDASPATYIWVVDATAPETTIDSNPADPDNNVAPVFTFSSTDGTATFECQVDGGGYSTCNSGDSFGPLGDGVHTFEVRAVDPLGNTDPSPASSTWTVDTGAPDTSIDSNPVNPSNSAAATFTFSSLDADAIGFECQLDGSGFASCTTPQNYTGLSAGSHTFEVRAVDNAANVDPSPASFTWTIDLGFPTVLYNASTVPANNATLTTGPTQVTVAFSEDVKNDGSAGAANNIANYLLVEDGVNNIFDTASCTAGLVADDTQITINSASYTNNGGNGPFVTTLAVNGGVQLPVGTYRLFVCGTTSIEDLASNELNNGASDALVNFTVVPVQQSGGNSVSASQQTSLIPATGFPQNKITTLPIQPADKAYASTDLWLEIPKLGVKMSIVGVPKTKDGWDVTWLNQDAGWLNGSAYPTWNGNSVITAHVWDALNKLGPFAQLKSLKYGDQVKIHAFGMVYTYEITESSLITNADAKLAFKHDDKPVITLITCEDYNETSDTYAYRRMVRAVLVSVTKEK